MSTNKDNWHARLTEECISAVNATRSDFVGLYRRDLHTHPIPFFGSIAEATVLTIGVNPSSVDFSFNKYPEHFCAEALHARFLAYFAEEDSRHPWFAGWEKPLSVLGLSYRSGRTAHLDLSPRATISMRKCPVDLFLAMIHTDITWFWRYLSSSFGNLTGILAAGTVTSRFYMDKFLVDHAPDNFLFQSEPTRVAGTKWYSLTHKGKTVPIFFSGCGPSWKKGQPLFERVERSLEEFRTRGFCK